MNQLFALNHYFFRYKWRLLVGAVFVVLSNYFRVLQPQIFRQALDMVIDNLNTYRNLEGFELQAELFNTIANSLMIFGLTILVLALIMGAFMYFMRQTIIVVSRLIEYDLRKDIFKHYESLSTAFFKRNNTGDLMARVTEDVTKVRMYLGPAVMYAINLVALFVMVIGSMISVSPIMTLYVLIPLPILSISIYYISRLINKRSEIIQIQLAKLSSVSQEVYSGIRVVKSYVQEKPTVEFFENESNAYNKKSMDLAMVRATFFPSMLLLIGASTIITIYVGGQQVIAGNITPGNIAEFIIYVNMLTWPVTSIGWVASLIQTASASQKRINEFMNQESEIKEGALSLENIEGRITFDKVSFVYPDTGIKAIENMSFDLAPGQKMAIIGKTGSGKTTIADLILRLYDPTSGTIKIDDQSLTDLKISSIRKNIGYVPQDGFLFSDTVEHNISFGKRTADLEEVKTFAKHAAIHEELEGLAEGYQTIVGERGVTLSGGQKQRISIARAFIKRPNIVILDDCLSAVDTNTEQTILGYLDQNLSDKTAIIITHRIYSLLQFDKIIVIDEGRIVEEGTHEDLLKNEGYYAEMYAKQSEEENTND